MRSQEPKVVAENRKARFNYFIDEVFETGIQLVDYLRHSSESLDRLLPVIMLTARSEPEYVTEARDKGVTEFLGKPFNVDSLYRRIASVIARPRAFVNSPEYFGPDRRRRQQAYTGPNRRN